MISTSAMIKMGKVYNNLMVDLKTTNDKLKKRAISIIVEIAKVDEEKAKEALNDANNNLKLAIVMIMTNKNKNDSKKILDEANGVL